MRRKRWALYLWPGLPQLWLRGSWLGLAVAVVAAALLDVAVLASFGWSELTAPGLISALWATLGVVWVASAGVSIVGSRRDLSQGAADAAGDGFERALEHYLRGDWFQAERLLVDQVRHRAADLEARLTLATLLRHLGRREESAAQLDLLVRFEGAEKWEWEVRRERELLSQARDEKDGRGEQQACSGTGDPPADRTRAA